MRVQQLPHKFQYENAAGEFVGTNTPRATAAELVHAALASEGIETTLTSVYIQLKGEWPKGRITYTYKRGQWLYSVDMFGAW